MFSIVTLMENGPKIIYLSFRLDECKRYEMANKRGLIFLGFTLFYSILIYSLLLYVFLI